MAHYPFPGVYVREIDISTVISALPGVTCAIVGASAKGPVNKRILLGNAGNVRDLTTLFGPPDVSTSYLHYCAIPPLEQGAPLYVTRVVGSGALSSALISNAVGSTTATHARATGVDDPVNDDFRISTVDAVMGTGDGSTTTFTGTLANAPVYSISNMHKGVTLLTNLVWNSTTGSLTANQLAANSSINPTTGAFVLHFTSAVALNDTVTISYVAESADALFMVMAENPGVWGDNLRVKITNVVASNHTFDIIVAENVNGTIISRETWHVSRQQQKDGYGNQLYLEDRINNHSTFIRVLDNLAVTNDVLPATVSSYTTLSGGANGSAVSEADVINGWALYDNPNEVSVNILINGGYVSDSSFGVQAKIQTLCETRRDCFGVLDVPRTKTAESPTTDYSDWRLNTQNISSSFVAIYGPWFTVLDSYNDISRIDVPASGFAASVYVKAGKKLIGLPPAGQEDGTVQSGILPIVKLTDAYGAADETVLFASSCNYFLAEPGQGIVLWTQLTELIAESDLSRVHARLILIDIERAVKRYLKRYVGKLNTPGLQKEITEALNQFLRVYLGNGLLYDYKVVCNKSNNTPQTIDNYELHVDEYLQIVKDAEFIVYQHILTRTGVNFAEITTPSAF